MLDFLFKKGHRVEALIFEYLKMLKLSQESFSSALDVCLVNPYCENSDFLIRQTHKHESKADDIREEIKTLMYGKALIPDSRGDIMGLLEALDNIPRLFEHVLYTIHTQKLMVPDFIADEIKELVRISLECCDLLLSQATALFRKTGGLRSLMHTIDTHESHCDHIERRIITKVFDSGIDPFHKLQLKELVILIGDISDEADRTSRRINIIDMKRRV